MYAKAEESLRSRIYTAENWDELRHLLVEKPGFVKAAWCGDPACEEKIKDELQATSRCIADEPVKEGSRCVCCGREASKVVYWGKAY